MTNTDKKQKDLYTEVHDLVANIRNKLTPLWTLSTLVNNEIVVVTKVDKIMKDLAKTSETLKTSITNDLSTILQVAEKHTPQHHEE